MGSPRKRDSEVDELRAEVQASLRMHDVQYERAERLEARLAAVAALLDSRATYSIPVGESDRIEVTSTAKLRTALGVGVEGSG